MSRRDVAAENRDIGEAVEDAVVDALDLYAYAGDKWDAVTSARGGRPVEIKATRRTYANGRTGRFRLRDGQHHRLKEASGMYVFVLYSGGGQHVKVESTCIMDADAVHQNLPLDSWARNGRVDVGREKQVPWTKVEGL
jgi:hypothetical protein